MNHHHNNTHDPGFPSLLSIEGDPRPPSVAPLQLVEPELLEELAAILFKIVDVIDHLEELLAIVEPELLEELLAILLEIVDVIELLEELIAILLDLLSRTRA